MHNLYKHQSKTTYNHRISYNAICNHTHTRNNHKPQHASVCRLRKKKTACFEKKTAAQTICQLAYHFFLSPYIHRYSILFGPALKILGGVGAPGSQLCSACKRMFRLASGSHSAAVLSGLVQSQWRLHCKMDA